MRLSRNLPRSGRQPFIWHLRRRLLSLSTLPEGPPTPPESQVMLSDQPTIRLQAWVMRGSTRFSALLIALALSLWLPQRIVAAPFNIYSVGNSLTVDLRASGGVELLSQAAGRQVVHDYHVRCGSSLNGIVANMMDTCLPSLSFGNLTAAFASEVPWTIDVVTLQPFYADSIRQEVAAARTILQAIRGSNAGRNSRILVYATWPSTLNGPIGETWANANVSLDSPFVPSQRAYEIFLAAIREFEPNASLIPAGHAWVTIAEASETLGAFAGVSGSSDLYRDSIHASNLGRYVAGLVTYSAIFGEPSSSATIPWQYSINGYGTAPVTTDLSKLEDITWQTVQTVPEPRFLLPAIIVIMGIVAVSRSRRTWNLRGLAFAYPFPRSFPHHVPEAQAAIGSWEAHDR